jgi:hypothetical protein
MVNERFGLFIQRVLGSVSAPDTEVIRNWDRHSDTLPPSEQPTIDRLADIVADSFDPENTTAPLGRITVIGHADKDPLGAAFEKKVSDERALTVAAALAKAIIERLKKRLPQPPPKGAIAFDPAPHGVGATQPDPNAVHDRRLNRRVVVTVDFRGAPPVKPVTITKVKFWLNAFIPAQISGLTVPVPGGIHEGKTMLPGPPLLDFFLTDNRSFSSDVSASSRMHSEFEVTFGNPTGPSLRQFHKCDLTIQIEGLPPTGRVLATATGSTAKMGYTLRTLDASGDLVAVDMKCASSMPLFAASPDIDFNGTITINRKSGTLQLDAKVDAFPAFEALASINGGTPTFLFIEPPRIGATPFNLPGQPEKAERFRAVDRDKDGVFRNVEPF